MTTDNDDTPDDDEAWEPTPAALRDDESEGMDAHARRNAEMLRMARGDPDERRDNKDGGG